MVSSEVLKKVNPSKTLSFEGPILSVWNLAIFFIDLFYRRFEKIKEAKSLAIQEDGNSVGQNYETSNVLEEDVRELSKY